MQRIARYFRFLWVRWFAKKQKPKLEKKLEMLAPYRVAAPTPAPQKPTIEEKRCPHCESKQVIPIVYGYPSNHAQEQASLGLVRLGGCMIQPFRSCCRSCGLRF